MSSVPKEAPTVVRDQFGEVPAGHMIFEPEKDAIVGRSVAPDGCIAADLNKFKKMWGKEMLEVLDGYCSVLVSWLEDNQIPYQKSKAGLSYRFRIKGVDVCAKLQIQSNRFDITLDDNLLFKLNILDPEDRNISKVVNSYLETIKMADGFISFLEEHGYLIHIYYYKSEQRIETVVTIPQDHVQVWKKMGFYVLGSGTQRKYLYFLDNPLRINFGKNDVLVSDLEAAIRSHERS